MRYKAFAVVEHLTLIFDVIWYVRPCSLFSRLVSNPRHGSLYTAFSKTHVISGTYIKGNRNAFVKTIYTVSVPHTHDFVRGVSAESFASPIISYETVGRTTITDVHSLSCWKFSFLGYRYVGWTVTMIFMLAIGALQPSSGYFLLIYMYIYIYMKYDSFERRKSHSYPLI